MAAGAVIVTTSSAARVTPKRDTRGKRSLMMAR
jgi:hypothetical protein